MPTSNDYRNKAIDCLRQAEAMHNPQERAIMLQVAQAYMKLAKLAGRADERGVVLSAAERARPEKNN
jgi:hypothetical protein